ncbi:hypothetical protein D3C76_340980 [compost metagenome]
MLPDIPFKLDRIGPRNDLPGRRLRSSQSDKLAIITTEIIFSQIHPADRWARRGPQIHKHDIRNPIVNNFDFNITICFIRPIKLVERNSRRSFFQSRIPCDASSYSIGKLGTGIMISLHSRTCRPIGSGVPVICVIYISGDDIINREASIINDDRLMRLLLLNIPFKLDRISSRKYRARGAGRPSQSNEFFTNPGKIVLSQIHPARRSTKRRSQIHKENIRRSIMNDFNLYIAIRLILPVKLV